MKKRNLFAALILTVIAPGLGHVYLGRFRRGLSFVVVAALFLLVATFTPLLSHYVGAAIYFLFVLIWLLLLFIDVTRLIWRQPLIELKSYQKWYAYPLSFILFNFVLVLSIGTFHALGYQAYYMATQNERLMVKKSFPYVKNIKRNEPVAVVVYLHDLQKTKTPSKKMVTIISKVYAVFGDSLTKKGDQIYLNGKPSAVLTEQFSNSFKATEINIVPGGYVLTSVPDKLHSQQRHLTFIPQQNIVGQALYILWSKDFSRIGKALGSCVTCLS